MRVLCRKVGLPLRINREQNSYTVPMQTVGTGSREVHMNRKPLHGDLSLNKLGVLCGAISLLLTFLSQILTGNQSILLLRADLRSLLPPLWLLNLLSLFLSFLLGYAGGSVTEAAGKYVGYRQNACFGGLFFLALLFLNLIRHPLFFGCGKPFLSLLATLCAILCAGLAARIWMKVCISAALITGAYVLWLFYLLILNLSVLFHF